jgi:Chalcone isomerase-like
MMVNMRRGLLAVAISVMGLVAGNALAQTTVAGVKYEPEISLGGQKLQLNGAGVRYRAVFKVYAAALYTPAKVTKNEEAIKATASRMHLVALRDVGGDEFGKLFTRSMEANASKEEFSKSINSVIRMGQIFADAKQLSKGDVILLDYVPGTGTTISHKGKQLGDAFKEPEFHSLMMKIWFGPKPVDEALRGALLGGQTTANTNVN